MIKYQAVYDEPGIIPKAEGLVVRIGTPQRTWSLAMALIELQAMRMYPHHHRRQEVYMDQCHVIELEVPDETEQENVK